MPLPIEREWIFVDDCSTDRSFEILNTASLKHGFKVLRQTPNQGKGCAIVRAIGEATGDFVLIQDADLEYDPCDVPSLLAPLLEGKADVVYGSRFKKNAVQVHRTYHYFVNRTLTTLSNLLSGVYLTDMETCYKIFPRDLLQAMNLRSRRLGLKWNSRPMSPKIRARIYELPISYFPRTRLNGKKISWRDGIAALWHLIRFNLFTPVTKAYRQLPDRFRLQDEQNILTQ